jgi:hypothetical protein
LVSLNKRPVLSRTTETRVKQRRRPAKWSGERALLPRAKILSCAAKSCPACATSGLPSDRCARHVCDSPFPAHQTPDCDEAVEEREGRRLVKASLKEKRDSRLSGGKPNPCSD